MVSRVHSAGIVVEAEGWIGNIDKVTLDLLLKSILVQTARWTDDPTPTAPDVRHYICFDGQRLLSFGATSVFGENDIYLDFLFNWEPRPMYFKPECLTDEKGYSMHTGSRQSNIACSRCLEMLIRLFVSKAQQHTNLLFFFSSMI